MPAKFETLGTYLQRKRRALGLSQNEVSDLLGYSGAQFISNLERGISQLPLYTIPKVASVYRISPNELADIIMLEQARLLRAKINAVLGQDVEISE